MGQKKIMKEEAERCRRKEKENGGKRKKIIEIRL